MFLGFDVMDELLEYWEASGSFSFWPCCDCLVFWMINSFMLPNFSFFGCLYLTSSKKFCVERDEGKTANEANWGHYGRGAAALWLGTARGKVIVSEPTGWGQCTPIEWKACSTLRWLTAEQASE